MKKVLVLALTLVLAVSAVAFGLTKSDYRVYFTASDGTCIFGIESTGIVDMIGGAEFDNVTSATTLKITETNIDLVGALAADAVTVSDVLTFSDGGTIDNTAADTLTITETNIDLVGALAVDAITASDVLTFSDGGTIDNTAADTLTVTEDNIALAGAVSMSSTLAVTGITTLDQMKTTEGNGAVVANKTTVVEYLGEVHKTVLTFTLTGDHDLDLADGDHGTGIKVYDLPEGRILILGATIDASITTSANYNASTADVYYVSMGTVVGADDNDLTGTEADIIPKSTIDTDSGGTLTADWHNALASSAQFDGTATAVDLYVNAACPDANNSDANTYAITGTVTILWVNLGDY